MHPAKSDRLCALLNNEENYCCSKVGKKIGKKDLVLIVLLSSISSSTCFRRKVVFTPQQAIDFVRRCIPVARRRNGTNKFGMVKYLVTSQTLKPRQQGHASIGNVCIVSRHSVRFTSGKPSVVVCF